MSNVFVGFHDRKSCSRILKPPGGGTSDIFGTEESARKALVAKLAEEKAAEVKRAEKEKEDQEKEKEEENGEEEKAPEEVDLGDVVEEKTVETKSETLSSVIHHGEHKESQTGPQKRIGHRVPPGGYSSGLW